MLPSSVRRVVAVAPPTSILSNFAPTTARATAATAVSYPYNPRNQQRRRYSSSKPSSPNDSPKGLPAGQMTASPGQSSKSVEKPAGEKRKRRAKDNNTDGLGKLPSVPSTHHVPQEALALSTFFSLHRPMSITQGCPRTVSDEAFAQIFAPRSKTSKYTDVMSTLSKTVDELEQPMQSVSIGTQQDSVTALDRSNDHMHKVEVRHPDGSEVSVQIQLNAMSGQFLPFRPPPLPQPQSNSSAETRASQAVDAQPQTRVLKAIFTLEETTEANGEVRIMAHSPTLIDEDTTPRTFLERMALRQLRQEEVRGRPEEMVTISVRRQRKLKMKKKKYKKLMKRTRTERRKLDRV
ncbi:putative Mitochondrial mRNA-processing protein COX24 C-terminal domain-containing protein [Seiridium unicorne]|uniref:Small ribosomal subunit protein mS38 n=1 Tax=Seiridium unicorne TaxID=138068 RepID=A0ABR2VFN6_9PEZI